MPIRADDLGVDWFSSTYSDNQGGACVQGGRLSGALAVRDSKNPHGPAFVFRAAAWTAFVDAVKQQEEELRA